jgi:superfamily II DNA/RNA helicase
MILDNKTESTKIANFIAENIEEGNLDIVTGYFTIGALVYLSDKTNEKIESYRMILGDLVQKNEFKREIDLLNENLSLQQALKLSQIARKAVKFLKLDKVSVKTLEPNFCHAKLYLHDAKGKNAHKNKFFISGSSNLTEAGIGLKHASNLELNVANFSENNDFSAMAQWFENLWVSSEAKTEKTIEDKKKIDFKKYLIQEISKIFDLYTPEEIYYKILFELFNNSDSDQQIEKQIKSLQNTLVWNKLYDFQQVGVKSLLSMLDKFGGGILADAVGLGKTWSALCVMKAYQMKGYSNIIICPKKLRNNWEQYKKQQDSVFEEDKLDFEIINHTSLNEDLYLRDVAMSKDFLFNDKPKLIVIDESHNLRNDKSERYKFLVEYILKNVKGSVKILLLSATPLNTSFNDVRNQFKLIVKGDNYGFKESLGIGSLEHIFRILKNELNGWQLADEEIFADFYNRIKDSDFFKLTNNLLVSRTRKAIKTHFNSDLEFPKHEKVGNIFKTPMNFSEEINSFDDLLNKLNLQLFAYRPSIFTLSEEERDERSKDLIARKGKKDEVLTDSVQREYFLVRMMMVLMMKRLESSWESFRSTIGKFKDHHQNLYNKLVKYQQLIDKNEKHKWVVDTLSDELKGELEDADEAGSLDNYYVGKKNPIPLKEIFDSGNLEIYTEYVKSDLDKLSKLFSQLEAYKSKIDAEKTYVSLDEKLEELIKILDEKSNQKNKKAIIFTVYNDTAVYLYNELSKRGFKKLGLVSGSVFRDNHGEILRNMEDILQKFAPYTKLYNEKNWLDFEREKNITKKNAQNYPVWQEWIKHHRPDVFSTLNDEIDILIATDVLSEGQNLQDADMVINYDIHWNPVRVIQRVGRVDRIGSPNSSIKAINFWPALSVDDYINLHKRVKDRMANMTLVGSEVVKLDEEFEQSIQNEELDKNNNEKILKQIEESFEDADGEKSIGFDDFSFDNFRQMLRSILEKERTKYENMPHGVFSGFIYSKAMQEGIVALLSSKVKAKKSEQWVERKELLYINADGHSILNNEKVILDFLGEQQKNERFVPEYIAKGDNEKIEQWTHALKTYLKLRQEKTITDQAGNVKTYAGNDTVSTIKALKMGNKDASTDIEEGITAEKIYHENNVSLLAWMIISKPDAQ